jgi:hypothetical protein
MELAMSILRVPNGVRVTSMFVKEETTVFFFLEKLKLTLYDLKSQ